MHSNQSSTFWQVEFHCIKTGARNRAPNSGDLFESQEPVESDRILHDGLDRIQAHAPVANVAGFVDDGLREYATQAPATKLRTKIKALHLTDSWLQRVERHTSRQLALIFRQQQAAVWRRVIARKSGKFFVEALKAEAETERLRVFEEKLPYFFDLRWRLRLYQTKTGNRGGHRGRGGNFLLRRCLTFLLHFLCVLCGQISNDYPISIPPFTFNTCPVM